MHAEESNASDEFRSANDPAEAPVSITPDVVERLVQRALAESTHPAARGAPRSEVVIAASARLERLLEGYGQVEGLRQRLAEQRESLTAELSRVRGAVVARRGFLESEADVSVWPVDSERWRTLRWRVQARLAALLDGAETPTAGASRLAAQELMDLFAKERAASLSELRRRADAELVQLERRLQALATTVEQAEEVFEVLREAPIESGGLASYYREHEGLDANAKHRETKLAILQGVYRQNLELQRGEE